MCCTVAGLKIESTSIFFTWFGIESVTESRKYNQEEGNSNYWYDEEKRENGIAVGKKLVRNAYRMVYITTTHPTLH